MSTGLGSLIFTYTCTDQTQNFVVSKCSVSLPWPPQVPGAEGRAGMAAIIDDEGSLNLEELYTSITKILPSYARPLFLRTVKQLEMTG